MPCYHPIPAWFHSSKRTEGGAKLLLFSYHPKVCQSVAPDVEVACGRCIGCRLAKSREWASRCMHEASLYWQNCWVTLTLNDDYKNSRENPYSVQRGSKSEMTLFLKRLRKKYGSGIRYFYCAEYGETCFFCNKSEQFCECGNFYPWRGRPHYHLCLFNHDFQDKRFFKTINGCDHYTSDELDSLWTDPRTKKQMGNCTVCELTTDNAAYTARYSLKKITGDLALEDDPVTGLKHYQRITPEGELVDLVPEFVSMSRRPGIGREWLETYKKEVLDNDKVFFKQLNIKPPPYYDKLLQQSDPQIMEEIKFSRIDKAENSVDNTPERLAAREMIAERKALNLYRKEI
jgi:hypothetical protein